MRRIAVIFIVAILGISCQTRNYFTKEMPELKGQEESILVKRWGNPKTCTTNTVASYAQSPDPWRPIVKCVLSLFPTNQSENLFVEIKMLSWTKGRVCFRTWLRRSNGGWVVIYGEKWNMDVIE